MHGESLKTCSASPLCGARLGLNVCDTATPPSQPAASWLLTARTLPCGAATATAPGTARCAPTAGISPRHNPTHLRRRVGRVPSAAVRSPQRRTRANRPSAVRKAARSELHVTPRRGTIAWARTRCGERAVPRAGRMKDGGGLRAGIDTNGIIFLG